MRKKSAGIEEQKKSALQVVFEESYVHAAGCRNQGH
jgi:hypothetical protein